MQGERNTFARNWLVSLTGAEAAAIAVVALTYALIDRGALSPGPPYILAAGAWEGLCLGTAQALMLRHLGTRVPLWVALTVAGAVAGYALSILGGAGGADASAGAEPPMWLMALAGAGAGIGMGSVMGLIQLPALPAKIHRLHWVLANAAGWAVGMAAIILGASLVGTGWSLGLIAVTGALSGALAGFAVAVATLRAIPVNDGGKDARAQA